MPRCYNAFEMPVCGRCSGFVYREATPEGTDYACAQCGCRWYRWDPPPEATHAALAQREANRQRWRDGSQRRQQEQERTRAMLAGIDAAFRAS